MNKKYIAAASVLIVFVIGTLIFKGSNSDQSITRSNKQTISSTTDNIISGRPLLQDSPYIDSVSKFSINLPKNWVVQDKVNSTTTSNTWFYNPIGSKTDTDMMLVVGRFERTEKMNQLINERGADQFIKEIANGIKEGINTYQVVSTSSVMIGGVSYNQTLAKYMGSKSKKEITQYTYLVLSNSAYYLIGTDVYSEIWEKNKDMIMNAVNTFKILP